MSEEMILGLGAGMGFIYWKMKMGPHNFVSWEDTAFAELEEEAYEELAGILG